MTPRTRLRVDPPAQRTVDVRFIRYRIPLALVGSRLRSFFFSTRAAEDAVVFHPLAERLEVRKSPCSKRIESFEDRWLGDCGAKQPRDVRSTMAGVYITDPPQLSRGSGRVVRIADRTGFDVRSTVPVFIRTYLAEPSNEPKRPQTRQGCVEKVHRRHKHDEGLR